jgi:hypothetical protein
MAARLARHVSELQAEVEDGDEAERRLADEAGQVHALRAGVLCAQAEAVPEARRRRHTGLLPRPPRSRVPRRSRRREKP